MKQQHFLIVTFPVQSHINPGRHIARRLALTGADVTLSTAVSAHRRMFPTGVEEHHDGLISYIPYSESFDDRFRDEDYMSKSARAGFDSLNNIARSLSAKGRPVTCIIYTVLLTWAIDVAHELAIPSVLFWLQPATVFAIFHHYFHGYEDIISSCKHDPFSSITLPRLPHFRIRDLPFYLTLPNNADDKQISVLKAFRNMFQKLDTLIADASSKLVVLVNTFEELEPGVFSVEGIEMLAIGPTFDVGTSADNVPKEGEGDLFERSEGYMEWLDTKNEGSVVYVSFGSVFKLPRRQIEEISRGLVESGRPYLWVLRKDNRGDDNDVWSEGEMGMVVEWCSQLRVLEHRSVGCFVTHSGWNSTLEGLACGVPMVMVPQGVEQPTNARLAAGEWGVGVRAEVGEEQGVVEATELRRCVDVVMDSGGEGAERRKRVKTWREKALQAVSQGGSSVRNMDFVKLISLEH